MTARNLTPILVASHPRSGTHLTIDTIRRQFRSTRSYRLPGLPTDHLYLNVERVTAKSGRKFDRSLAERILSRPRRPILKTHFMPGFDIASAPQDSGDVPAWLAEVIDVALKIYVIRHPFPVLASYHQYSCAVDPDLMFVSLMDFAEGPHWAGECSRAEMWARHAVAWAETPDTEVFRYEDLVQRPTTEIERISRLLGEQSQDADPPLPPKIKSITMARLLRVLQASPASTAIVADARRWRARSWQQEFGPAEVDRLWEILGSAASRFGYAKDGSVSRIG